MVLFHSVFWVLDQDVTGEMRALGNSALPGAILSLGLVALWLPAVAGTAMAVREKSVLPWAVGICLLALATAGNALLWSDFSLWRWDIAHFIGFCFLIFAACQTARAFWLIPVLGVLSLLPIFGGFFGQVAWPFFPWFFLFAVGACMGWERKRKPESVEKTEMAIGLVLVVGGVLFPSSTAWFYGAQPFWLAIFSAPASIVVALGGGYLLAAGALRYVFVHYPSLTATPDVVQKVSYAILWIFIVHILVGVSLVSSTVALLGVQRALYFYPTFLLLFSWAIAQIVWDKKGLRIVVRARAK